MARVRCGKCGSEVYLPEGVSFGACGSCGGMLDGAPGGVSDMLKKGAAALAGRKWSEAAECYGRVLDAEPDNAEGNLGELMSRMHVAGLRELVDSRLADTEAARAELYTACERDEARENALLDEYYVEDYLEDEDIERVLDFDRTFPSQFGDRFRQYMDERQRFEQDNSFMRASHHSAGGLAAGIAAAYKALCDTLDRRVADAKARDVENVRSITQAYAEHLDAAERRLEDMCAEAEYRRDADKRRRASERQKRIVRVGVSLAVLAVVIVGVLVATMVVIPSMRYGEAEKLLAGGDYDGAALAFDALGSYKDSGDRASEARYGKASGLLANGDYDASAEIFAALKDYKDSSDMACEARYQKADALLAQSDYAGAVEVFASLGDYRDSVQRGGEVNYAAAEALYAEGDKLGAAKGFLVQADFEDSWDRAFEIWGELSGRSAIAAASSHTAAVKTDGTVVAVGKDDARCEVDGWTDVAAVSTGANHTVALRTDGTAVANGRNSDGQCNVQDWSGLVAVAAGGSHTAALLADGTVVAVGDTDDGRCDVSGWTDIVAIAAGSRHTVGLRSDGTVVAVGDNYYGQCDVGGWTDIVTIAAGTLHTVGLRSDGTVVATGSNSEGQCDVGGWTGIKAIAAGLHTVGLRTDGTVVAVGSNANGQCNVGEWYGIAAVSAGQYHTAAIKSNGSAVATVYEGSNLYYDGECDVQGWTGLRTKP